MASQAVHEEREVQAEQVSGHSAQAPESSKKPSTHEHELSGLRVACTGQGASAQLGGTEPESHTQEPSVGLQVPAPLQVAEGSQ